MEIITKKICLEDFISRVPSLLPCVEVHGDVNDYEDGSWGKIPYKVKIGDKYFNYKVIMDLYYNLFRILTETIFYSYDKNGKKWVKAYGLEDGYKYEYDWRYFYERAEGKIQVCESFPTDTIKTNTYYGIASNEDVYMFHEKIKAISSDFEDGISFIKEIDEKVLSKIVTESRFTEPMVPYFIFSNDIESMIEYMTELKSNIGKSACICEEYKNRGGDDFLNYLRSLEIKDNIVYNESEIDKYMPTLDIPFVLTTKVLDFGQYRTDESDIIDENGNKINGVDNDSEVNESVSNVVITSGESKLRTLRKRKRSFDDNGVELPFILVDGKVNMPYSVNYVKNYRIENDIYYGDMIYSMKEICTSIVTDEKTYNSFDDVKEIEEIYSDTLSIGGTDLNKNTVYDMYEQQVIDDVEDITKKLMEEFKENFPKYSAMKQKYTLNYELIYKGNQDLGQSEGVVYVTYDTNDIKMEVTYVIGGKLKLKNNKLEINEANPFNGYDNWEGSGIWYREHIPLIMWAEKEYMIDGKKKKYVYNVLDFKKKEMTYEYDSIDFPRKNYILCEEIIYKTDAYKNDSTQDTVFKDEKMIGLNFPLKEKYNVVVDRGSSAAFEKHLQLTELKTWDDLEKYRNGMFLNN